MSRRHLYSSNTSFLDLLFNALLAFTAFFMMAFILINPKTESNKKIDSAAEMMVVVTWDKNLPYDVDTYVEDPHGHLVYFQRKEDGLMHLERDDLGGANDSMLVDGKWVHVKDNREVVVLRGIAQGEYVVNVHLYSVSDSEGIRLYQIPKDIDVTVELIKLNPRYSLKASKQVKLTAIGEEVTAFRFTINEDNEVVDVHDLPKSLTKWQQPIE